MRFKFLYILLISLLSGCSYQKNGELLFVEPTQEDPFHFPYFLFIPDQVPPGQKLTMIIEPNNSGFVDDELQKHIEKAERTASKDFYLGNYVAQKLKIPLLVPVFPRSKTNWKIYTHSLDRDVMIQKNGPLERIDEQLLAMFQDARKLLKEKNITTGDKFLLTGFSASGTFANRFALLHPDKILAVAAGGLNGLLMLPMDTLSGEIINYPIGTNDLIELTNRDFQKDLFLNLPQFYFMGELDDNDAIPYDDAFDENEREQIFRLLGKEMQPERWQRCENIYANEKVNVVVKTYKNTGHEHPDIIKDEIVTFFQKSVAGNQDSIKHEKTNK
ncbi:MAG: hypothetical protein KQI35_01340 [Bacteroidetes bacterium]|nr:hypothetical protein [Bacteroidota bacterium]